MDLFRELLPDTSVLTPNSRLAATFAKKYHAYQLSSGNKCWSSLDILPLTSWKQRLWDEWSLQQESTPIVLSSEQENILWEEILSQSPQNDYLLQIPKTAEVAKSAWSALKAYRVDIDDPAFQTTEDGSAFQLWAQSFQALCLENDWIDMATMSDALIEGLQSGEIIPPKNIILLGFTEITPHDQYLIDLCRENGSQITTYQQTQTDNTIERISLTDEDAEIRAVACWAKQMLDDHTGSSPISIGCVFPTLDKVRDKVIQVFSAVFCAENTYTLNHTTLPFNISAGKRLSEYPVIHAALELLNLQVDKIPLMTLSNILRSPFLGEAESEMLTRANLDSALRRKNISVTSLGSLLEKNSELSFHKYCPKLAKRSEQYLDLKHKFEATQSVSAWVTCFMELLNTLGWPGERSLNSQEYQVVKNWLELLTQYSQFNAILPAVSYKKALNYLTRLTSRKIFQPQSPEAPVQILGLLEAAEIPFDALWITGLDDTAWPTPPQPNPFIPQRIQKTLQMPRATAEREFEFCRQLTEQLKQSGKTVILSHAEKNKDTELRASALITEVAKIELHTLRLAKFISPAQRIYQSKAIEQLVDDKAPAISNIADIRGGVSIFKQQAACPFRAYAEYRLNARALETPTLGLSPQERGTIMHKALELIWQQLKNHDTLSSLQDDALKEIIHQKVEQAILGVVTATQSQSRYHQLETQRLNKIIWKWMQIEKARPRFHVVAQEQEVNMTIANIPLTIRVDRIDEVDNGNQLIIDYKTGKTNEISFWFSDRPEEPQLPIYCMINPDKSVGIAFAELHPEKMALTGVSEYDLNIKTIKPLQSIRNADNKDWRQQIKHWQTAMEKLGTDFCEGDAKVDPKESTTCNYCHLQSLCRIYEY